MIDNDLIYKNINFGNKTIEEAWQDESLAKQMIEADESYLSDLLGQKRQLLVDIKRLEKEALIYSKHQDGVTFKNHNPEEYELSEILFLDRKGELAIVESKIEAHLLKSGAEPVEIRFLNQEEEFPTLTQEEDKKPN